MPPRGATRKLITSRYQAEIQGTRRRFDPHYPRHAGPPACGYALMPGNQTPSYGQIAPLPCGYLWQGKAKGVNPDRKSGAVPLRRLGGELHRLSGSNYGWAVDKTLRSTSLLSIAAWRKGGSWRLGNPWSPHSLLRIQWIHSPSFSKSPMAMGEWRRWQA